MIDTLPRSYGSSLFNILPATMSSHCCEAMRYHISTTCSVHEDRFDCPDALIHYNQKFDEYGIIVHDGGSSVIEIRFCPWCGTELPPSKREAWHAEVARRGLDPNAIDLPEDLRDDEWWRSDTS